MSDADLGPKPEPEIEPGEPNPGGVDAIDEIEGDAAPVPADLSTEDNPSVDDDAVPDEVQEGEDTSTEATERASDDDNTGAADESDRDNPA